MVLVHKKRLHKSPSSDWWILNRLSQHTAHVCLLGIEKADAHAPIISFATSIRYEIPKLTESSAILFRINWLLKVCHWSYYHLKKYIFVVSTSLQVNQSSDNTDLLRCCTKQIINVSHSRDGKKNFT